MRNPEHSSAYGVVVSSPLGHSLLIIACVAILCTLVGIGTYALTIRQCRSPILVWRSFQFVVLSSVVALLSLGAAMYVA